MGIAWGGQATVYNRSNILQGQARTFPVGHAMTFQRHVGMLNAMLRQNRVSAMLGLFSAKVDHPLADANEARRVFHELPALEASEALASATAWLESLVATPEFRLERRLDLTLQIDEAVLPHTRRLARDYLTTTRQGQKQAYRTWQISRGYWDALATAYRHALSLQRTDSKAAELPRPQFALLCARLLHAYGGELKWDQFHYGYIDGDLWLSAGAAYAQAIRGGVADKSVRLYATAGPTTPEAEYLKLLLLQASSMDNLLPVEIEIAERLITHLLPAFSLTDQARPDNLCWIDFAKPLPPTRLTIIPEITPSLRFFATGSALAALVRLQATIEAHGVLPADINFGGQYSLRVVLPVIKHLASCWSTEPPMRSHERRVAKWRLTITHGMAAIRSGLLGELPDDAESWVAEDVSHGGIGAQVPLSGKDWVSVGALVGLRPEGGSNWLIGVVRRLGRASEAIGGVGIASLSRTPCAMTADSKGLPTEFIALDPLIPGTKVRLALAVDAWEEQAHLGVELEGRALWLFPTALIENAAEHVIGQYLVEASR
jgi:hypothetical protein